MRKAGQIVLLAYALLTHMFLTKRRVQEKHFTEKSLARFSVQEMRQSVRSLVVADMLHFLKKRHQHSKKNILEQLQHYLLAA